MELIWLALFRIRLGICLPMHVNEGKIRNFPSEEKLEIKSPGENKRNRGNHGITYKKEHFLFL